MKRHWITVHYPHYAVDAAEWFIYWAKGRDERAQYFGQGDRVAFYEVLKGPDRVGKGKRPKGEGGLRCIAIGAGPSRPAVFQEEYADGTRTGFTQESPCIEHNFRCSLPKDELF